MDQDVLFVEDEKKVLEVVAERLNGY